MVLIPPLSTTPHSSIRRSLSIVPQANENTRQSRFRHISELNPSMAHLSRPITTYGKRNKPLLLRGTHFMRSDPYETPPDVQRYETPVPPRPRPPTQLPDPDDSPLSEGELDAVYGKTCTSGTNASPPPASQRSRTCFERRGESRPPRTRSPLCKKERVQAIKRGITKTADRSSLQADPNGSLPLETTKEIDCVRPQASQIAFIIAKAEPAREARPCSATVKPRRQIIQLDSAQPKVAGYRIAKPTRRIPVDELLLVPTPPEQPDYLRDSHSSFAAIQTQDPIADSSSPSRKRRVPQVNDRPPSKETPLTSIRKRLKTPNYTHRSIVALRKRKNNDRTLKSTKADRNLGDGFDASELKAPPSEAKKQRKNGTKLLRGLAALQVHCGPLPEVKFEVDSGQPKVEQLDGEVLVENNDDAAKFNNLSGVSGGKRNDRRVTFSNNFFDETTRAQLSLVSAPKRVFEISSDESEQEEEDEEGEDDSDGERTEIRDARMSHDQPDDDEDLGSRLDVSTIRPASPTSFQRVRLSPSKGSNDDLAPTPLKSASTRKTGVTLDFRKSATPGTTKQTLQKQRLMEVDEMIMDDDVFVEETSLFRIDNRGCGDTPNHNRTDVHLSAGHARRPRSILRTNTPILFAEHGTRPEDTVANTRRNSNVLVESEYFYDPSAISRRERPVTGEQLPRVDGEETVGDHPNAEPEVAYETTTQRRRTAITLEDDGASYFGMASNQLYHSRKQTKTQKRRISPRPDAAASNSFVKRRKEAEVQVLDSSRAVPETSPPLQVDCVTNLGMGNQVVGLNEETTWTPSQSLPTARVAKSLKTLTNTVSREYGTLSQVGRRRSSLPSVSSEGVKVRC